jgi:2-keto-4-pentenoate hydratase/2-oxohepta-3-ene-1,7-dioic acid hydratase in catechol pathway
MSEPRVELCNLNGRAALLIDGRVADLEQRSAGRFASDPMSALARWDELCAWAATQRAHDGDPALDPAALGPCVPRPGQVFAIGLNYRDHAREAGLPEPAQPMVFTKFASCLTGARGDIELTSDAVDWEVELVAVIGKPARRVAATRALEHVAGYCVGQDVSDRRLQFACAPPQFSLGKSAAGFGPIGPTLVARRSLAAETFALRCDVDGVRMQDGTSEEMIFPVPVLVEYLSRHVTLQPGDLIFTGTPAGVGSGRKPPQFLKPGNVVRSEISGLGVLENRCVAAD